MYTVTRISNLFSKQHIPLPHLPSPFSINVSVVVCPHSPVPATRRLKGPALIECGHSELRLSIKKSLFPVQRAAKIVASWVAAFFFSLFFSLFFFLLENIVHFWKKKRKFANLKKKVSSLTFFSHPVAKLET